MSMSTFQRYHSVLHLGCPAGMTISQVIYSSYGKIPDTASLFCDKDALGYMPSNTQTNDVIESLCLNQQTCSVYVSELMFHTAAAACPKSPCRPGLYATAKISCQIDAKTFAVDPNFGAWSRPQYVHLCLYG